MALSPTSSRGSSGGSSFPPTGWTVDANGGLTINPTGGTNPALTLVSQGDAASTTSVLLTKNASNIDTGLLDSAGSALNWCQPEGDGSLTVFRKNGNVIFQVYETSPGGDLYTGFFGAASEQALSSVDPRSALEAFGLMASGGPTASEASTLALGTAYQHSTTKAVLLLICLNVTVNTSGVLKLGVGSTNTPTQQTIVSGVTATGQWFIPIFLPAGFYTLLSTAGTITVAVDGQIAMSV